MTNRGIIKCWVFSILAVLLLIAGGMAGCPQYTVYQQTLSGKARLAEAESSRKITVEEAEAKNAAAVFLAKAEVTRAHGVAEAQKIINNTLTDRYIRWLQAESISEQECDVRYVPTEAQLPLLEARDSAGAPRTK